jgi:uncharacterized membrane protein
MPKDLTDTLRSTAGDVAHDVLKAVGDGAGKKNRIPLPGAKGRLLSRGKPSPLSGARGVAAGAALAALAPLAKKGVDVLRSKGGPDVASKVGDSVGEKVKETVSEKVDEAGGAGGVAKQAVGGALGLGSDGGGGDGETDGVGKGRRMPVQQSCDVAAPLETVYNQFTQFAEWPSFMHRVTRVTQEDECTVSFATKIWGVRKQFTANIETQRPDERIKWRVAEGITHTGVVSFHELAPRLTRIELTFDVDPGSLIEKFARGARHVKRAARADLHRFKAFVELQEHETGAWRGVIEDGELVEDHPDDYDHRRDREATQQPEEEPEEAVEEPEEEEDEESQRARTQRFERQLRQASSGRSRSRSRGTGSGSGTSRSASGRSTSRSGSSRGTSESRSGRSGGQRKKSSNRR